jgi:hypothetical protein
MTPAICACGSRHLVKDIRYAKCSRCSERDRKRRYREAKAEAKASQNAAQGVSRRLYRALHAEPGWPKGIVLVGGALTICMEGNINRHAHAGTLVGVCNQQTALADLVRAMRSMA